MKALLVDGVRSSRVAQLDEPHAGSGEVRVRVAQVGICGTDFHVFDGGLGLLPIVLGHDGVGVIDEIGAGVPADRLGVRVVLDPSSCCARNPEPQPFCTYCAQGATNVCVNQTYMGITAPGCAAEFVVVPSARAVTAPVDLSGDVLTCLEPLVVALRVAEKVQNTDGNISILGAGPIGLAIGLLLQARGRTVTVVDPVESRREFARAAGITQASPLELLTSLDPVVIDASGSPSAADVIERLVRPLSTIVLVGGATTVSGRTILTRELEVRSVKGGRGRYEDAMKTVALMPGVAAWTQTHVSIDEAPALFAAWSAGAPRPFRTAIRL